MRRPPRLTAGLARLGCTLVYVGCVAGLAVPGCILVLDSAAVLMHTRAWQTVDLERQVLKGYWGALGRRGAERGVHGKLMEDWTLHSWHCLPVWAVIVGVGVSPTPCRCGCALRAACAVCCVPCAVSRASCREGATEGWQKGTEGGGNEERRRQEIARATDTPLEHHDGQPSPRPRPHELARL